MDFIEGFGRKYFLRTSGIIHVALYVLFRFRPVKMNIGTVNSFAQI